jgi:hypothetical protein
VSLSYSNTQSCAQLKTGITPKNSRRVISVKRSGRRQPLPVVNIETVLLDHFAASLIAVCKKALTIIRSNKAKIENPAKTFLELTDYEAGIVRSFRKSRIAAARRHAEAVIDKYYAHYDALVLRQAKKAFMTWPAWKRKYLGGVSQTGHSFSSLARELWANDHKYPGITRDDLAVAWTVSAGTQPE